MPNRSDPAARARRVRDGFLAAWGLLSLAFTTVAVVVALAHAAAGDASYLSAAPAPPPAPDRLLARIDAAGTVVVGAILLGVLVCVAGAAAAHMWAWRADGAAGVAGVA